MDCNEVSPVTEPSLVIEAERGFPRLGLVEIWESRDLLFFLVWRDVKVRYKQTVLGVAWAILQPLLTAAVFTIFFGRVAGIPTDGTPYSLFAYSGLVVWTFFAQGVTQASGSLVGSVNIVTRVYFPRVLIPTAAVVGGLVDLIATIPVLLIFLVFFGVGSSPRTFLALVFLGEGIVATLGVGLWLAAANALYRDVRYVVPFLIQVWLFLSPVIYPSSVVIPRLEEMGLPSIIFGFNPMTGAIEGFRWAMLGTVDPDWSVIALSAVMSFVILASGILYFRFVERTLTDVI